MRAPLAALLLLLALSPGASARPDLATLEVAPFEGRIAPETEEGVARVTVRVPCAPGAAGNATAVRLSLAEAPPPWLAATLSPDEVRVPAGPCAGERVLESTLRARFTAEAPAFRTHVLHVAAVVSEAGASSRELRADVPAQAGPVVRLAVRVAPDTLAGAKGAVLTFPLEITNLGNHHVSAMIDVVDNPDNLNVVVPPPAIVVSRQAGSASNVTLLSLQVQVTDVPRDGATFRVRVHPASAFDPRIRGEPQEVTLHVERADGNAVPGAGLHGALLALGAGAVALRRARGRKGP